jgi:hypothetical protein
MKTSLVIFGVIFLVIGALLFFVPMQQIEADTTTTDGGNTDIRTSSASVTVPAGWAYASMIIGLILLVLGFVIPNSNARSNSRKTSYDKTVESKENVNEGNKDNPHRITKERTERYKTRGESN